MIDLPVWFEKQESAAGRAQTVAAKRGGYSARRWLEAWRGMAPVVDDEPEPVEGEYRPIGKYDAATLAHLQEHGETSLPDLCYVTKASRGTMRYLLDTLEQFGLIESRELPVTRGGHNLRVYRIAGTEPREDPKPTPEPEPKPKRTAPAQKPPAPEPKPAKRRVTQVLTLSGKMHIWLADHDAATPHDIAEALGVHRCAINRLLREAVTDGTIERIELAPHRGNVPQAAYTLATHPASATNLTRSGSREGRDTVDAGLSY